MTGPCLSVKVTCTPLTGPHLQTWRTRASARSAIFEYIEAFYNLRRIHSTLQNVSPVEFENRHSRAAQSA